MKICCISDIHNQLNKVNMPDADLLVIAGDLTMGGTEQELLKFRSDIGKIKNKYPLGIVVIAGNHDFILEEYFGRELIKSDVIYLEDNFVIIKGIKIYGSPYSCEFGPWAFMLPRRGELIRRKWSHIPEDSDILLIHGPPNRILDRTKKGDYAGCEELTKRLKDVNFKLLVTGHIHEAYGTIYKNGRLFVNASTCNLNYNPVNPPIIIEINEETKECKLVHGTAAFPFEDRRRIK